MAFEKGMRARLLADPAISAIVGVAGVYAVVAPQGATFPHIVYQGISKQRGKTFDGPDGTNKPLMQFTCWATLYGNVRDLANKLILDLDGFQGVLPAPNATKVLSCFFNDEREDYDPDQNLHRIDVDFEVWFAE